MALRYDHIHIIHTDPAAAVRFYKDILGAKETARIERGGAPQATLEAGGTTLLVRGVRDGEMTGPAGALPRLGVDHFGFWVEPGTLDRERKRLADAGVPILQEGDVAELRFLYFQGPDGVVIEFMEAK